MRVLIAGCGYVGRVLAARLVAAGDEVVALRRRPGNMPSGVSSLAADLTRPETLSTLPRDCDAVVYTAGPDRADEAGYRRAYVDGVRNLHLALADAGARPARWLFASSTAVYGQSGGEWVDEESPTEPTGFSGRVLLEAEAGVHALPLPTAVVRFGGLYGPGRTRLIDSVREGRAVLRPGPPHYTNRIHRDDAAAALQHLLGLRTLEPCYLGVDGAPADDNEVLCFLAEAMGLPRPREAAEGEDLPRRRAGSKRCRPRRLVASGFRFSVPSWREGYGAMLRAPAASPDV